MANHEKIPGDISCKHTYTRQDKKTFQILTRVCTNCGRVEHVCDNDKIDIKKLME